MPSEDHAIEHICSVCSTSFTRKTHLTRHLRSHANQRSYVCTLCNRATFTRSDLLTRHVKRCSLNPDGVPPSRKKSCLSCIQRKVKCDLQNPCAKCASSGTECTYASSRSYETGAEPSSSRMQPDGQPFPLSPMATPSSHPLKDCVAHALDGPVERPESWEGHPHSLINKPVDSVYPFLHPSDCGQNTQSVSISCHSRLPYSHARNFGGTEMSNAGSSMDYDPIFDSFLSNSTPRDSPNSVPFEAALGVNASFFDGFLSQIHTPTFQNPNSLLPSVNVSADTMVDTPTPVLDNYLAAFFSFHCRQFPFVHLPTWCESCTSPLLLRVMRASGALYLTGTAERKAAQKYINDTLQSNLRQEIFRAFINTPVDDIDSQSRLILALAYLQLLGLYHRCHAERSASTGYHGMMVTMVRKSSLPAFLEKWNSSEIEISNLPHAWISWARYETTKRVLLIVYLHDVMLPVFHNLPSLLEENELHSRLPCDNALWEAPNAHRWAAVAEADPSSLRGVPLHSQLALLLSPRTDVRRVPLNRFACFVTLHALLHAVMLERGTSIPLQRALAQWYACWTTGSSARARAGEQQNFTSSGLPLYWLAQLLAQVDGTDPVSRAGQVRYATVKRWLKRFWSLVRAIGETGVTGILDPTAVKQYVQAAPPEFVNEVEGDEDYGLLSWVPC